MIGGSSADTLDPSGWVTDPDLARTTALFDPLIGISVANQPVPWLAESVEPQNNDPSKWIIRLRQGVEFHDGHELTAADVLYTFQRIIKTPLEGALQLKPVDVAGMKALDRYTVYVPMVSPFSSFKQQLMISFVSSIVPVDFNPKKPVGTGPFKYASFSPGVESTFVRNANYWMSPEPYVDSLVITDFPDPTSLQNALLSNDIDACGALPPSSAGELASSSGISVLDAPTAGFVPITMRMDKPPFNDVRVRQAFRLLVDRDTVIQAAYAGHATYANDVFGETDVDFDHSLHRTQDVDQAKFLLKQAGQSDLHVALVTAPVAIGMVEMAQVFAEQANAIGLQVALQDVTSSNFFNSQYLERDFSQDFWVSDTYLCIAAQGQLPGAPYNECHRDDPQYSRLYTEANATLDPVKERDLLYEMQTLDFNQGGYIIPCFFNNIDAHTSKLNGFYPYKQGPPLSNCQFRQMWFS